MPNMMDSKEAKAWNKVQADILRKLADVVEEGNYEALNLNTVVDYLHFLGRAEALPERMKVFFELTYVEGQVTHADFQGAFGEPKTDIVEAFTDPNVQGKGD